MEGDKSSEGRGDGSAMASAVSSRDSSKSNVSSENRKAPTLDKKTFADQFEQRMQAKIEKEKECDNGDLTKKAPDAPSPAKTHVMCAAGHHCMADPEIAIDLINSPHDCLNCCEKMHDPSTCGEMFDEVEDIHGFAVPTHMLSENGQLKLREHIGAPNLAICCMCIERFRLPCLLKGTTAETSTQAAKGGLEVVEGSPPVPIQDSIYQDSAKKKLNMELESVGDGDEAPRPSAYASAQYDEMDAAIKRAVKNTPQMSPPVPPAAEVKMAAMVEDTEIENKKKAFISPDGVGGNGGEPPVLTPGAARGLRNAMAQPQLSNPITTAPALTSAQNQAPAIIIRPPPRSMLTAANRQSTKPLPILQATLVEDDPEAPVYDAIPVDANVDQSLPWYKRPLVLGMGCVIVVLGATLGAVIGNNMRNSNSNSNGGIDIIASGGLDIEGANETSKEPSITETGSTFESLQPSQSQLQAPSLSPTYLPEKSVTIGGYVFRDINDMCHTVALDSRTRPSASSSITTEVAHPYGYIFSIENDGTKQVDISSLSFMLDTSAQVIYSLYVRDGFYITDLGDDGTVGGTAIGMKLSGQNNANGQSTNTNDQRQWREVASGEFLHSSDFSVDKDGSTMIPFSSIVEGGRTIALESGAVKSLYLQMTDILLQVERGTDLVGETVDEVVSGDNGDGGGLKLYVGRGVLFSEWIDPTGFSAEIFDELYYPARLLGKVWTEEACPPTTQPSISIAPTSLKKESIEASSDSVLESNNPTPAPSSSLVPTTSAPPSSSPTVDQIIALDSCACDDEGECMAMPVTLTFTSRTIKICLNAWPNNSNIELPYVQVSKHRNVPLSYELVGNSGIVTGTLPEDFFDIGPLADVIVLGKADIFGDEVGFMVRYKLESLENK